MKKIINKMLVVMLSFMLAVIPSFDSFAASTVTFSNVKSIPDIHKGRPYDITGTITASNGKKITYFQGKILKGNTQVMEVHCNPNKATVDIHSTKVNDNLTFGKLDVGSYKLVLYAKDSSGASATIEREFKVIKATSELTFNISFPSTLTYGKKQNITGTITSNYKITKVVGRIYQNNVELQKVTVNPNVYTFNVGTSNINYNIKFADYAKGSYVLKISAWDADGQHDYKKSFTIK